GDRIHERPAATHLDRADLDEVARERGLGDLRTLGDEQVGELALAVHRVPAEQLDDAALPLGAAHDAVSPAVARMPGSASRKPLSSSSERTSGGASRSAVGVTALTMKPASLAAAMAGADGMPSSSIARSSPRPRVPATPGTST